MNSKLKSKPHVFYAIIVLLLILIAGCSAPASTPVAVNETTEQEASTDVATKVVETVKAEPSVEKDTETGDTSEAEVQQEDDKEPAPVDETTTEQPEPTETPVPEPGDTATPEPTDTPVPPAPADTASPTPAPDAIVNPATIKMRSGPGTDYQVVDSYSQGTAVDVLGKSKDGLWLQVKAPGGKEGWMSKNLLSVHVALDSIAVAQAPPKPTPKPVASQPGQISAPSLREYQEPTFTWSWPDINKLQDARLVF